MRESIWRNILSVRTFFVGSSRGMARRSGLVTAVPRLKRPAGVTLPRVRERSGLAIGNGAFRAKHRVADAPQRGRVREAGHVFHSPLCPGRRAGRSMDVISRPVRSSVRSVPKVAKKKGRIAAIPGVMAALKRMSQTGEKRVRGGGMPQRTAPAVGRGTSSVRSPAPVAAVVRKARRHVRGAASFVVRRAVTAETGAVCVPPVRKQAVGGQSYAGTGREHDRRQVFLEPGSHREPEAPRGRLDHEVRSGDFPLDNRRSRLAARRSGGGVDEIMQPQYPGRSIGFF